MEYVAIGIAVVVAIAAAVWFFFLRTPSGDLRIFHLRLRDDGLNDIPAVPITIRELVPSLVKLGLRTKQTQQAKYGLSNIYTIKGHTQNAYSFLYGTDQNAEGEDKATAEAESARKNMMTTLGRINIYREVLSGAFKKRFPDAEFAAEALGLDDVQQLALDSPDQFSISWTTFYDVAERAEPKKELWSKTMTDPETATTEFWPTIADYGMAFNLIIAEKISSASADQHKSKLGDGWTEHHDGLLNNGALFVIDMSVFETLQPHRASGAVRFTPATVVYLHQDAQTKQLRPFSVVVSGHGGANRRVIEKDKCTDGEWLYALMAAKTSVGVWGIWIGHVYHWHIVTAAMQMTMFNNINEEHPVRKLMDPQSEYLITFDVILLLLWKHIAPPTSLTSGQDFLKLMNTYSGGRTFFDDDPKETLKNLNIDETDFTPEGGQTWDAYPTVRKHLYVWQAATDYVDTFVDEHFTSDAAVQNDKELQEWISQSADPDEGNIRFGDGFKMDGTKNLKRVLTSLIYRITAHGCSRMNVAANPAHSFVANFPPCMQDDSIPPAGTTITTQDLLQRLPHTGTIGEMVTFLYTFIYSTPYEPLIPITGVRADLYFDNQTSPKSNEALVAFRQAIRDFIPDYSPNSPVVHQWPRSIET